MTSAQEQSVEEHDWVELPDSFRPQPGHFVTRVVGESMNRRIPNGSWCLFKANPGGTRQGKVVIVEHRDIQDPETGTSCTVKVYSSEKIRYRGRVGTREDHPSAGQHHRGLPPHHPGTR